MKQLQSVLCFISLVVLAGCLGSSKQQKAPASQLINDIWILESLNGYPLEKDSFDREKPRIEIKTKDGMYFGYSGCNNMSGQIVLTETNIEFRPGPMTRKACIDGANIESDFMKALLSSKSYQIKAGKLELKNAEGKVVCLFRKTD